MDVDFIRLTLFDAFNERLKRFLAPPAKRGKPDREIQKNTILQNTNLINIKKYILLQNKSPEGAGIPLWRGLENSEPEV